MERQGVVVKEKLHNLQQFLAFFLTLKMERDRE